MEQEGGAGHGTSHQTFKGDTSHYICFAFYSNVPWLLVVMTMSYLRRVRETVTSILLVTCNYQCHYFLSLIPCVNLNAFSQNSLLFIYISAIQPTVKGLYLPGHLWADSAAENSGVLLWQHPIHEGLPENCNSPLQRLILCASLVPSISCLSCGSVKVLTVFVCFYFVVYSSWRPERRVNFEVVQRGPCGQGKEHLPGADEILCRMAQECRGR